MLARRVLLFAVFGLIACTTSTTAPAPASPDRAATPAPQPSHWTYSGATGPEHWGELDPSFAACSHGATQSPIDLPSSAPMAAAPARPAWSPVPLRVSNKGYVIQVDDTAPSSFTFEGTRYTLAQFHVHTPAEHSIAGRAFDAELHLVHKSADGKILVIALLFVVGNENATLEPVWDAMPAQPGPAPVEVAGVAVDVSSLLPKAPRYLRYDGSLTVPPCTEGVTWLVVEPDTSTPLQVSAQQIARMRAILGGDTRRPIQDRRGRALVELVP